MLAEAAASVAQEPWWQAIMQTGAIGAVLVWFMFMGVKVLRENTRALNLHTLATACAVLALKHSDQAISELATKIKQEVEDELRNASKTPAR